MNRNFLVAAMLWVIGLGVNHAAIAADPGNSLPQAQTHAQSHVLASSTVPININSANVNDLMSLRGIGPVKAQAILDYRQKNGVFKTVNDLEKIKGFSQKTISTLQKNNPGRILVK